MGIIYKAFPYLKARGYDDMYVAKDLFCGYYLGDYRLKKIYKYYYPTWQAAVQAAIAGIKPITKAEYKEKWGS